MDFIKAKVDDGVSTIKSAINSLSQPKFYGPTLFFRGRTGDTWTVRIFGAAEHDASAKRLVSFSLDGGAASMPTTPGAFSLKGNTQWDFFFLDVAVPLADV